MRSRWLTWLNESRADLFIIFSWHGAWASAGYWHGEWRGFAGGLAIALAVACVITIASVASETNQEKKPEVDEP